MRSSADADKPARLV